MSGEDADSPYANFSGTGNTLHTANRAVRHLILESLRYWKRETHVDGFRFDLASVFTRNSDGSVNIEDPAIISQIGADPDLADARLIAEPWDAAGVYQLGRRFPGTRWMQWNGAYRDTLQRFIRGDAGMVSRLMTRLYGSADLFPDDREHALRPFQSINYVTSHDGFTLYDLVSFNHKQNWANGQDNRDGHHCFSWNCGWEGDHDLPEEILLLRKRQVRNLFCLLMLSNGVPMFRMGDEFLQTQGGNNNPYNQDNRTSWLDWSRLDEHADIFRFFREMITFRKAHPSLCRSRFWREDLRWYGVTRHPDLGFESRALAFCLKGRAENDKDIYAMINAWWEPLEFGIHEGAPGQWQRIVDTSQPSPEDIVPEDQAPRVRSRSYVVDGRSVVVLVRG
jgi:glycogen operon protein